MAQQTPLTGSPVPIEISAGGYSLQAPGLLGSVTEMSDTESATRSDSGFYEQRLLEALQSVDIFNPRVFEIEVSAAAQPTAPDSGTRAADSVATTRDGEPAIVLSVPSLGDNVGYAVLYTDEAGVSRWVFPEGGAAAAADATRGGAGEVVFHLPRDSAPTPPAAEKGATRGPISKIGRRLVRVLAWATDDIIGKGALAIASRWEEANRPYGFRRVPFDDSAPVAWDELRQGRALMLIHGTFSRAEVGFGQLPAATIGKLAQLYGGRIFGFNHPTLYQAPPQNVQTLFDMLPDGIELDLDIMTHSRGGLVGRELVERVAEVNRGGRAMTVRKAVFVAAPHCGTILLDGDHAGAPDPLRRPRPEQPGRERAGAAAGRQDPSGAERNRRAVSVRRRAALFVRVPECLPGWLGRQQLGSGSRVPRRSDSRRGAGVHRAAVGGPRRGGASAGRDVLQRNAGEG